MKKYVIRSFLVHILILVGIPLLMRGCLGGSDGGGAGTGEREKTNEKIVANKKVEDNQPVEIELVHLPKKKEGKKQKKAEPCPGNMWFGGIGVETWNGTLNEVYEGYPAARAGLEPGDIIVSPPVGEIRGTPGTELQMIVNKKRTGETQSLTLIRDKICYEKVGGDVVRP